MAPKRPIAARNHNFAHGHQRVDVILRWLQASLYVKNTKLSREACNAFGTVLMGSYMEGNDVFEACGKVDHTTIRKTRVRLDFVPCLL